MTHRRKDIGDWGEEIAAQFLIEKGMAILTRNFRADRGEIDIIAQDADCIVFVEVKTGSHLTINPGEKITPAKQRQLYKIANHYIQINSPTDIDFRFDAVIVIGSPASYTIRHYPNAFYIL